MPQLERRLDWLAAASPESQAALLLQALPHAENTERDAICCRLVDLGRPDGIISVITRFNTLGPRARQHVRNTLNDTEPCLAQIASSASPEKHAAGLLAFIDCRSRADELRHLAPLLSSGDEQTRQVAGRIMRQITLRHLGEHGRRPVTEADLAGLDHALGLALQHHEGHRSMEVLLAAAMLGNRAGEHLTAALRDPDHLATLALNRVPARQDQPLVRQNLLRWLTNPLIDRPVLRWLSLDRRPAELEDLLVGGHLLRTTDRRRLLRRIDRPARLVPDLETMLQLTPAAQAAVVGLVAALRLGPSLRRRFWRDLLDLHSERATLARLQAVRTLQGQIGDHAAALRQRFLHDPDRAVVRVAGLELWERSNEVSTDTLDSLIRSNHPPVAAQATMLRVRRDPDTFWSSAADLPHAVAMSAAHELRRNDSDGFMDRLRETLHAPAERSERLLALWLIRRMAQVPEVEDDLLPLLADDDPRIVSMAISLLRDGRSAERLPLLARATEHDDARVRANAVDVLGAIGVGQPPASREDRWRHLLDTAVAAGLDSTSNRVRGNAIRAMMRPTHHACHQAIESFVRMLRDRDPLHRISALWVARQVRGEHLGTARLAVAHLAEDDPVPAVRTRALSVARLLDHRQDPSDRERSPEVALTPGIAQES